METREITQLLMGPLGGLVLVALAFLALPAWLVLVLVVLVVAAIAYWIYDRFTGMEPASVTAALRAMGFHIGEEAEAGYLPIGIDPSPIAKPIFGTPEPAGTVWYRFVHGAVMGGTGSNKTVGWAYPAVRFHQGALVINDPSRELGHGTAEYRARGGPVWIFDASTPFGEALRAPAGVRVRINPIRWIRAGTVHQFDDAKIIAKQLTDPDSTFESSTSEHFRNSALDLGTALIEHVLDDCPRDQQNFTTIFRKLQNFIATIDDLLKSKNERVRLAGKAFETCKKADRGEKWDVVSTMKAGLSVFESPIVADNTAESDFDMTALLAGDAPGTLYIQNPPRGRGVLMPLTKLLFSIMASEMLDEPGMISGKKKQHELLMIIDEFTRLGRMEPMDTISGEGRKYGIRLLALFQSRSACERIYGKDFIGNMELKAFCRVSEEADLRYLSTLFGMHEEERRSVSSPDTMFTDPGDRRVSISTQKEINLRQEEIAAMADNEQIVVLSHHAPVKLGKIMWNDPMVIEATTKAEAAKKAERAVAGVSVTEMLDRIKKTQKVIASYCGVCPSTITRWKSGEIIPGAEHIRKLAELAG